MSRTLALIWPALAHLARMPRSRVFRLLLVPMLVIAAAFVALHVSMAYLITDSGFTPWHKANLDRDRGYGERYEYVLMTLTVLALAAEYLRRRAPIYLTAGAVFGFLLLDNMWLGHESGGSALEALGLVSWHAAGELVYFAVLGLIVGAAAAWSLRSSDDGDSARALAVLSMIFPLAAFGVVVDLAHSLAAAPSPWHDGLQLLEEGGEMAMICVTAAVALTLAAEGWAIPARLRRDRSAAASRPSAPAPPA